MIRMRPLMDRNDPAEEKKQATESVLVHIGLFIGAIFMIRVGRLCTFIISITLNVV